jgi:hypothetical protein
VSVIARNQWGPKPLAVRVDAYGNPREARRLDDTALSYGEVEFVPADQLAGAVEALVKIARHPVERPYQLRGIARAELERMGIDPDTHEGQ